MGVDFSGIGRTTSSGLFGQRSPEDKKYGRRGPPSPHLLGAAHGLDLKKAIQKAKAALGAARPPIPDIPSFERLTVRDKRQDEEITKRLKQQRKKKLPSTLPPSHLMAIKKQLNDRNFVAKAGKEQVTSKDIGRLGPGQWLNDEIINFFGAMLLDRADLWKSGKGKQKASEDSDEPGRFGFPEPLHNIHYFNTFFYTKLENPGYDKARLGKWTKKVDIFSKDVVLIPINQGNAHWTCAAINFRKKRIEFYDSLGLKRDAVYGRLREYLDKEHLDKKKKPFDFTDWVDLYDEEMPQQENGYDCGVFVCMVMEALSRGEEAEEFVFDQTNMPYIRQRLSWEIGREKLS